ncbi:hypothetical protein [Brochothrix campestris]|uniref:Uncharacterized protein n=1 Tax=Brochothrix campestris FSL F6-1037 TaxID=1265861 RepID=W7D9L8_9LIST|nr:hypothetical protein [Brochothrix campestris]EUJ41953.1 hypothetical protein BCAMP_01040 [Brochothrix campestris FSL F6-1037]
MNKSYGTVTVNNQVTANCISKAAMFDLITEFIHSDTQREISFQRKNDEPLFIQKGIRKGGLK